MNNQLASKRSIDKFEKLQKETEQDVLLVQDAIDKADSKLKKEFNDK